MRIISYNINGIRAGVRKGLADWMNEYKADVYAFQEVKANIEQLDEEILEIGDYVPYYFSAEKKGYSGVAFYVRANIKCEIEKGFDKKYDSEGRVIIAKFNNTHLYNVYFPNGQSSDERLQYKMDFYDDFLLHIESERKDGKQVIVCGDYNTAHNEIDIARPKQNENRSGFLPIERKWMDKLVKSGYIDTFRDFYPDEVKYSWWSFRQRARENNVGWRLDYFFVNDEAKDHVKSAFILNEVVFSDHCPVGIDWE